MFRVFTPIGNATSDGLMSTCLSSRSSRDYRDKLAASVILVLGYPRSGTTWLAKIIDSHPDVLYRHEPDELTQPRPGINPVEQISEWIGQRGLRSAGKRPDFQKSWRPLPLATVRKALKMLLAASERPPIAPFVSQTFGLPDLILFGRHKSVRAAIKLVNWDGTAAARTLPDCRCCLILRHPCGQIASVKVGVESGQFRFGDANDSPVDLQSTVAFAATHGVPPAAFKDLSDAAKFAWSWRAFNEPVVDSLSMLPNAKVVIYEELCLRPQQVAEDLFAFAGLSWNAQTLAFINDSTSQQNDSGYFDVFRRTPVVVDQWRQKLSPSDQEAIRAVVQGSPLVRYWPDLL